MTLVTCLVSQRRKLRCQLLFEMTAAGTGTERASEFERH
jgi:hypothetical protein